MRSTHSSPSILRPLRRRLQAILDTGSSGNDMPGWLTREIGCTEIENPLKHIPINTVLGQYFCNTISIVPIFGEVSTSSNSNFIILSFDLIQCNPSVTTEIKINERGNALSWVKLTFPQLDGLTILFEFIGRTLIADADELVYALRELNARSRRGNTPIKQDGHALMCFLDRMITTHLRQNPDDTERLMTDPEVIRIRFFERNPDLAMPIIIPAPNTRTPIRGTTTQRIGPFAPTSHTSGGGSAIKMGSVSVGGSAIKLGSASVGGSAIKLGSESVGGSTKGQGSAPRMNRDNSTNNPPTEKNKGNAHRSFTASVEEEVIKLDVSGMRDNTLPTGGKRESDRKAGIQHLRDNKATMDLDPKDFRIFTYWIREKGIREHMIHTLRAACSIAKSTNQTAKYDRLMKMGNLWKHFPNMAGWRDAEEVEGPHLECYTLKVDPENYHENGHDTLDLDTRARLEVELYYAHREARTPEERNVYRRIYTQLHPRSYQFRNLRMMMEDDDYDNDRIPNLIAYQEEIEIREEEFEKDDNEITGTDARSH